MVGGPNAFARIEQDWVDFRTAAEECLTAEVFHGAEYRDVISRLSRLCERYDKERSSLTGPQAAALDKAFIDDDLIKSMMNADRQISEHIQKRQNGESIRVYTAAGHPVEMDCETSAGAYFSALFVDIFDVRGNRHNVNHLKNLAGVVKRITRAMEKARSS